ncbi:uncharacterized protein [Amphiura filiformis]|uniref:uncharacterized protein n=1 Tax=Amphiura filiformis TaxID=82378 RepID=UPI003B219C5D
MASQDIELRQPSRRGTDQPRSETSSVNEFRGCQGLSCQEWQFLIYASTWNIIQIIWKIVDYFKIENRIEDFTYMLMLSMHLGFVVVYAWLGIHCYKPLALWAHHIGDWVTVIVTAVNFGLNVHELKDEDVSKRLWRIFNIGQLLWGVIKIPWSVYAMYSLKSRWKPAPNDAAQHTSTCSDCCVFACLERCPGQCSWECGCCCRCITCECPSRCCGMCDIVTNCCECCPGRCACHTQCPEHCPGLCGGDWECTGWCNTKKECFLCCSNKCTDYDIACCDYDTGEMTENKEFFNKLQWFSILRIIDVHCQMVLLILLFENGLVFKTRKIGTLEVHGGFYVGVSATIIICGLFVIPLSKRVFDRSGWCSINGTACNICLCLAIWLLYVVYLAYIIFLWVEISVEWKTEFDDLVLESLTIALGIIGLIIRTAFFAIATSGH